MELMLIRHGQPHRSNDQVGPADPGLTASGHRQADGLVAWLTKSGNGPTRVVSSHMRRARETAAPIGEAFDLSVEVDERLAEFDLGSTSYVPMEIAGPELVAALTDALQTGVWGDHRFDPDAFEARVLAAMREILTQPHERVIVVCHGGVINTYLAYVLGRSRGVFVRPRYTSVSRLRLDRGQSDPHLESINELPHADLLASPDPPARDDFAS